MSHIPVLVLLFLDSWSKLGKFGCGETALSILGIFLEAEDLSQLGFGTKFFHIFTLNAKVNKVQCCPCPHHPLYPALVSANVGLQELGSGPHRLHREMAAKVPLRVYLRVGGGA